eukprot:g73634.t1
MNPTTRGHQPSVSPRGPPSTDSVSPPGPTSPSGWLGLSSTLSKLQSIASRGVTQRPDKLSPLEVADDYVPSTPSPQSAASASSAISSNSAGTHRSILPVASETHPHTPVLAPLSAPDSFSASLRITDTELLELPVAILSKNGNQKAMIRLIMHHDRCVVFVFHPLIVSYSLRVFWGAKRTFGSERYLVFISWFVITDIRGTLSKCNV